MDYRSLLSRGRVHVADDLGELTREHSGLLRVQWLRALVTHILEQRYSTDVLHDQIYFLLRLEEIVELADVRVVQLLHADDFALNGRLLARIIQFTTLVDLDGYPLL